MAKIYPKRNLSVRVPQDSLLSYALRRALEGASQTFIAGAPVVLTAGLIVEAANPITDVYGVAMRAGQNAASGTKYSEFLPVVDGVEFYANQLTDAGADNVLAAADAGAAQRVIKGAFGVGGAVIWCLGDNGATAGARIVTFESDIVPPNVAAPDDTYAVAGDTNARVSAIFLDSIRSYD